MCCTFSFIFTIPGFIHILAAGKLNVVYHQCFIVYVPETAGADKIIHFCRTAGQGRFLQRKAEKQRLLHIMVAPYIIDSVFCLHLTENFLQFLFLHSLERTAEKIPGYKNNIGRLLIHLPDHIFHLIEIRIDTQMHVR